MNVEKNVMHSQPHRRSKSVPSMFSNSGSQGEGDTELQPLRSRSGTDSGLGLVPSIRSKSRLSSGGLLRSQSKKRRSINGLEKSRSVDSHDERNNSTTSTSGECIQSADKNHDALPRRKHGVFAVNHLDEQQHINMDDEEDFHGDRRGEQTVFVEGVCETESSDVGDQQQSLNDDIEHEFSRQNIDLEVTEKYEQNVQKRDNLTDKENINEQTYNNEKTPEDFSQFRRRSLPVNLSKYDTGLNMDYQKGHEQFKHISTENTTTCEGQELRKYNSMPSQLNKNDFDVNLLRRDSNNRAGKMKRPSLLEDNQTDTSKPDDNLNESHENVTQKDQFYMTREYLVDDNQSVPNENMASSEQHEQTNAEYSLSSAQKVITHEKQLEKLAMSNHSVTEHKDDKPVNNAMTKYKRVRPKRQRRTKSLPALLDLEEVPEDKEEEDNVDKSLEDVARQHVNKAFYELLKRISRNQAKKTRKQVRRTHSLSTIHERQVEEIEQLNDPSLMYKKNDNNDITKGNMSNDPKLKIHLENNVKEIEQNEHAICNTDKEEDKYGTEQNCNNAENVNHVGEEENTSYNEHESGKTCESMRVESEYAKTSDNENKVCEDARKDTSSRESPREERRESSQKEIDKELSEQSEVKPNDKKKKKKRKKKKKGKGAQAQPEEEQPEADSSIQEDLNGIQEELDGVHGDTEGNENDGNEGDFDNNEEDMNDINQKDLDGIQGDLHGPQGNLDGIQGELASSPEVDSTHPESYPESDRMQQELGPDDNEVEAESFPEADQPQLELAPESDGQQLNLYPEDDETQSELRPEDEQSQNELCSEDDYAQIESYPEDDRQQSEPATEDDRQHFELNPEDDRPHAAFAPEDVRQEPDSYPTGDREESEFLPEDERAHPAPYLQDTEASEHVVEEQAHNEDNTNITEQSTDEDWFVISIEAQEETATIDYHPEHETQQESDCDDHSTIEIPQISVSQVPVEKSRPKQIDHHEKHVAIDEIDDPEHFHNDILEHVQSIDYASLDNTMLPRPRALPTMESIEEDSGDFAENTEDNDHRHYTFKRTGSIRRKVIKGNMSLPLDNTAEHVTKRVTWSEDLIEAKSPDTPTSNEGNFGETQEQLNETIDEEDGDNEDDNDVVDGEEDVFHDEKDFDDMVRDVINSYLEPDYNESKSPVHRAVARGCVQALMELIDDGVDVNADDEHGWPPLHVAMLTNNVDCAAILIEAGANLQQYTDTLVHEYYTVRNEVMLCS